MGRSFIRPACTKNLGTLIDEGVTVRAWCTKCGKWKDVDLVALAAIKGRDYDLWNRRTRCKMTPCCDGWNKFQHDARFFMRPMRDLP